MDLQTKFNLGQLVTAITESEVRSLRKCSTCNGSGRITTAGTGEEFICPKCGGMSAYPKPAGTRWYISIESKVGKIGVEARDPGIAAKWDSPELEIQYMLMATGVESGQLWKEENLFASVAEAEAECARRNVGIIPDEDGAVQLKQEYHVSRSCEYERAEVNRD